MARAKIIVLRRLGRGYCEFCGTETEKGSYRWKHRPGVYYGCLTCGY